MHVLRILVSLGISLQSPMALDDVQPFDNTENDTSFGPREQKASRTLRKDDDNDALSGIQRNYAEKKLVRRLDMRLMPAMVVIFLMNTIDVSLFC